MVYEVTLHARAAPPGATTVLAVTMELSDYGAPVTVKRPGGTVEQVPGK
ncbi:hypothetical protein [Dactylosporangium sp. CA-092794]